MALVPLYTPRRDQMRLALFMSGSGTNAREIVRRYATLKDDSPFEPVLIMTDNAQAYENARTIGKMFPGVDVSASLLDFKGYLRAARATQKDAAAREGYNELQAYILRDQGIDAVALAGWDWVVTGAICSPFLTVNVHPGDLRLRENGKPLYRGLAWVPSAKAILNGEDYVHSSVHVVIPELDAGPLLAVSESRAVPADVAALPLELRVELLEGNDLKELIRAVREIKETSGLSDKELEMELANLFPLYRYARACQEDLKVHGDWVIFPTTIERLAEGGYAKDDHGAIHYQGKPVPHGVGFGVGA